VRRYIAGHRGREVLLGSGPARSSITALCFGQAAAHYGLGDEVTVRFGWDVNLVWML